MSEFQEIEDAVQVINAAKKEAAGKVAKILMVKIPEGVQSIAWKQYSPHFNDGSECTFSVYDYLTVKFTDFERLENSGKVEFFEDSNEEDSFEIDNSDVISDSDWIKKRHAKTSPIEKEYIEMLKPFCEVFTKLSGSDYSDIMEAVFGNHVQVIITANDFTIEEYTDHD